MNSQSFRAFLSTRGISETEITHQIGLIKHIEDILRTQIPPWSLEDINAASAQSLIDEMIDRDENTAENLQALLWYAQAIGNQDLFNIVFEIFDCCEAMDNLHAQLADRVGEDLRDIIFEDLPLPPLGLSKREKARYSYRIMRRMVNIFEEHYCREILSDGLSGSPDAENLTAKSDYTEICENDLDRYLDFRRKKFIEDLRLHQTQGTLYRGQEITDDVINFVENHPEIGGGVRAGHTVIETKLPHDTQSYLTEEDPEMKRYYYCHCPWVRESLRRNASRVPAVFCQCSAGFHKKPWEVIFGVKLKADVLESVLRGDNRCRFVIYLPQGEVEIPEKP